MSVAPEGEEFASRYRAFDLEYDFDALTGSILEWGRNTFSRDHETRRFLAHVRHKVTLVQTHDRSGYCVWELRHEWGTLGVIVFRKKSADKLELVIEPTKETSTVGKVERESESGKYRKYTGNRRIPIYNECTECLRLWISEDLPKYNPKWRQEHVGDDRRLTLKERIIDLSNQQLSPKDISEIVRAEYPEEDKKRVLSNTAISKMLWQWRNPDKTGKKKR